MSKALDLLKETWGFNTFRGQQEAIVNAVANGLNCFVLLPTGGGKSICYQLPALMNEGVCVVISPLIALMQDQVSSLQEKGIKAQLECITPSSLRQKCLLRREEGIRRKSSPDGRPGKLTRQKECFLYSHAGRTLLRRNGKKIKRFLKMLNAFLIRHQTVS